MTPFALVNGEVVITDKVEDLYNAILAKIGEADAWDELDLD